MFVQTLELSCAKSMQSAFVSYILYALSISAAKFSILLLYRRIFPSRQFKTILDVLMVIQLVWCLVVVFLALFRCRPVSYAWSPYSGDASSCIDLRSLYYGTASSNILLDIIVNLLPAQQIWSLQLPVKQRVLCTSTLSPTTLDFV